MKKQLFLILYLFVVISTSAQIRLEGYNKSRINPSLYEKIWRARWISLSDEPANEYGVYHFRKTFELTTSPESFVVHVTADNRYKLYVNGMEVSAGPARGDIYNWNFETVDIARFLQKGKNVVAAVVWNYAGLKPIAQISQNQTGFLLQGDTEAEYIVNTNNTWLSYKNEAYSPWCEGTILGYYVAGPGELMKSASYPWGWETTGYNDTTWRPAQAGINGAMKGSRDYSGRLLVPSPIPPMEAKMERLYSVRLAEGISPDTDFLKKKTRLEIPANTEVRLLLDNKQLTTGYLSLLYSKGKDAKVVISYAEAMYNKNESSTIKSYIRNTKGDRNDITNKVFFGYEDKVIADGGDDRSYTTLWWRTWRYLDVRIKTSAEPLVLEDIYGTLSAYPFERTSQFYAPGHDDLNKILDIGWLTARLCANETYMDCPYYEQLQYFGDTRIQTMVTLYNTTDAYMVKNAIEQGRQSVVADGITMSRYPSSVHQFISSFSLYWICMGHDYWMYRGDEAYMKTLLPVYRNILSWYEQWLKPDYSLDYVPHWFFADWAAGLSNGEPTREKNGNSAFQDLLYLMVLDAVAEMESEIGIASMGEHYTSIASKIRGSIKAKYWNEDRKLFADTYDHRKFSQHVNSLAILTGIVTGNDAAQVMTRTLSDTTLIQATIYFRYYVHQALNRAGLGDQLLDNMGIWYDQMKLGLTTWAEMPEPSRSDCHAWGASPNIEFFRILLGISSGAPGFSKVLIEPSLGKIKEVSGVIPHPAGDITVLYKIGANNKLTAQIELPSGITGIFLWKGKEYHLVSGKQTVSE